MTSSSHNSRVMRIPHEQLVWGIIDLTAEGIQDRRTIERLIASRSVMLDELFQQSVFGSIGSYHTAYTILSTRAADTKRDVVLACGISIDLLRSRLAESGQPPLGAIPGSLPQTVAERFNLSSDSSALCESLNLLNGRFRPPAMIAAERKKWIAQIVAIVLVVGGLMWGIERRIGLERNERRAADRRTEVLLKPFVPSVGPLEDRAARAEAKLDAELRRLRASRAQDAQAKRIDAAALLGALLAGWPRATENANDALPLVRTESIVLNEQGATVVVVADSPPDATKWTESMRALSGGTSGWSVAEPQITALRNSQGISSDAVRVTLKAMRTTASTAAPGREQHLEGMP